MRFLRSKDHIYVMCIFKQKRKSELKLIIVISTVTKYEDTEDI